MTSIRPFSLATIGISSFTEFLNRDVSKIDMVVCPDISVLKVSIRASDSVMLSGSRAITARYFAPKRLESRSRYMRILFLSNC